MKALLRFSLFLSVFFKVLSASCVQDSFLSQLSGCIETSDLTASIGLTCSEAQNAIKDKIENGQCYFKSKQFCCRPKQAQTCGLSKLQSSEKLEVNGSPDDNPPGTWPWIGSLGYYSSSGHWIHTCGASLIANSFALTAAHCIPYYKEPHFIVFGRSNIVAKGPRLNAFSQVSRVARFIPHPDYNELSAYYDIALAKFEEPIKHFTDFVSPICLPEFPSFDVDEQSGQTVHIAGWGTHRKNESEPSKHLRSAILTIIAKRTCDRKHNLDGSNALVKRVRKALPNLFTSSVLCAGDARGEQGACPGDSGSPLQKFETEADELYWIQLGLVHGSVGKCASADFPGIYARLEDKIILDFIKLIAFGIQPSPVIATTTSRTEIENSIRTNLIRAAEDGDTGLVEDLISKGANVNQVDIYGQTPLYWAAFQSKVNVIEILLDSGANVEQANERGVRPLHIGAGHLGVVKLLVERGKANIHARTDEGQTPLYLASYYGRDIVISYFFEKGANINEVDNFGRSPLWAAASNGHAKAMKILIEKGANSEQANNFGVRPLNIAAEFGHLNAIKILVEGGVDIHAKNNDGQTALYWASLNGHEGCVSYLVEKGARVNEVDHSRRSPLWVASFDGHVEAMKILIDHGANVEQTDDLGWTSLHIASQEGHLGAVKLLVETGKANIHAETHESQTPLYWAARNGHFDVLIYLIQKGGQVNEAEYTGRSPLFEATFHGYIDVMAILIENGANIEQATEDGRRPLHAAAYGGHLDALKFLVEKGVDFHAKTDNGQTALQWACQVGHIEIVSYLIENGARVNEPDNTGISPLWDASLNGHTKVMRILLDNGADVEQEDENARRPLYAGAFQGHLDVVELLVESGEANIHAKTNNGETALDVASKHGYDSIVQYLKSKGA